MKDVSLHVMSCLSPVLSQPGAQYSIILCNAIDRATALLYVIQLTFYIIIAM